MRTATGLEFEESAPPREFASDPLIPEIATEAIGRCLLCNNGILDAFADGFDYEMLTCCNRWEFVCCRSCGHVQLDPRPDLAALPVIYPSNYYSYDLQRSVGPIARAGKSFLDRRKFRSILRMLGRSLTGYVDIGCGDGRYLDLVHAEGLPKERIFGLELDARAVASARSRGYQVAAERAETATSIPDDSVNLVTMFHVIEHVADPAALVRRIKAWMQPDSLLVIETPNLDSLDARLFRRRFWGGYHIPRHWHLFTPESLSRLLVDAGFEIERVSYLTGHSFWLFSFHHGLRYNARLPMPRLARLVHPLKSLVGLILVTTFDLVRAMLGFRTSSMMIAGRSPKNQPSARAIKRGIERRRNPCRSGPIGNAPAE